MKSHWSTALNDALMVLPGMLGLKYRVEEERIQVRRG